MKIGEAHGTVRCASFLFYFVLFGPPIGDVKPTLLFIIFLSLFTVNSTSVGRLQNVNKHIIGATNDLPALPLQNPNIFVHFLCSVCH
jgi:hypothetical protein